MYACDWAIEQLPGLTEQDRIQLQTCGITTTGRLLAQIHKPELKQQLIGQLQRHPQHLNKWIALADLARIPSVGCQYCGVLLHSGIASVAQLAQTPIHRLHRQILRMEVATMQRKDMCPPVEMVQQWIQEARSLEQG